MKIKDAIIKSMKAYYKGREPEQLMKTGKKLKYTKGYFDKVSSEFGIDTIDLKKGKS